MRWEPESDPKLEELLAISSTVLCSHWSLSLSLALSAVYVFTQHGYPVKVCCRVQTTPGYTIITTSCSDLHDRDSFLFSEHKLAELRNAVSLPDLSHRCQFAYRRFPERHFALKPIGDVGRGTQVEPFGSAAPFRDIAGGERSQKVLSIRGIVATEIHGQARKQLIYEWYVRDQGEGVCLIEIGLFCSLAAAQYLCLHVCVRPSGTIAALLPPLPTPPGVPDSRVRTCLCTAWRCCPAARTECEATSP